MLFMLLLVVIAGTLVAALILGRTWIFNRAGVDIEQSSAKVDQVERLNSGQLLILGLLLLPAVLFFLWLVVYVLAGAVLVGTGGTPATG